MKNIILLSFITINSLYADMTLTEKRKILEEKLYGKATSHESKAFYLPLKINDVLQDEVYVKIDNQENVQIGEATFNYITSLLKEEYKNKFQKKVGRDGFAPLSSLEQFGIKASYDADNILLKVFLPANIKKASLIRFYRGAKRDINGSILPKEYSGGVNFYLNQAYSKSDSGSFDKQTLTLSSDLHLNIHDYVLEGRTYYDDERKEFQRGRIRVVKDDVEQKLRYKAGDITLPAQQRMSYVNALGVGVEKLYNIGGDYSQNMTRLNSFQFFLQNPSRVEIYVNNRYRSSLNLDAGTHNLYDLNLPSGLNRVKLKVIERGGKTEFIEFQDFAYSEILKKGLLWYGGGAGVESQKQSYKIKYDKKKPVASAYVEYGWLDDVTVEGGIQFGDNYTSGGAEFLLGTNFGFFNPYIIASKRDGEIGYKKGVEYQTNLGQVMVNLSYEDIDEKYTSLSSYYNTNDSRTYRGSLYTSLNMGYNLGLTASEYQRNNKKERKYEAYLHKNFGSFYAELNLEQTEQNNKKDDTKIYASVDYRFGQNGVRYTQYLTENRQRVNLRHNSLGRYGWDSDLQVQHDNKQTNYYLRNNFDDEKFRVSANYRRNDSDNSSTSEGFDIQLATGVVFAGKQATITAPMTSGFIIVDNDDKLETPLGLEGYQESDEHTYDTYAVEMSDYTQRELSIDESNLDFGADLTNTKQKFISNYRSGAVMKIEAKNLFSVKGVFYDKATTKPLAFKAFKVFNASTGTKTTSFTNENGEFTMNEINIGHYNVSFMREKNYDGNAKYSFDIESIDKENLMNLGDIYIKMPNKIETKKYFIYGKENNSTK